jgi:hypothetical protein
MSATKVALAGLAALAGPMMYVADPVRPERPPPISAPRTIAEKAEKPAAVHAVRPGVRVILASPFDPPGTRQEAAAVSPSPGVPEVLYARDTGAPAMAVRTAGAAAGEETVATKARRKTRTAARVSRGRQPKGFFQAAPFFAWLR